MAESRQQVIEKDQDVLRAAVQVLLKHEQMMEHESTAEKKARPHTFTPLVELASELQVVVCIIDMKESNRESIAQETPTIKGQAEHVEVREAKKRNQRGGLFNPTGPQERKRSSTSEKSGSVSRVRFVTKDRPNPTPGCLEQQDHWEFVIHTVAWIIPIALKLFTAMRPHANTMNELVSLLLHNCGECWGCKYSNGNSACVFNRIFMIILDSLFEIFPLQ